MLFAFLLIYKIDYQRGALTFLFLRCVAKWLQLNLI